MVCLIFLNIIVLCFFILGGKFILVDFLMLESWEWREGRFLVYEFILKFFITNYIYYVFLTFVFLVLKVLVLSLVDERFMSR